MTTEEIKEIAIDSATNYYNYLVENNKGIQIVETSEIEYLQSKDFLIKLQLRAKLFDTDSIFFRLNTTGHQYDSSTVKVLEYDADRNIILIKIFSENIDAFSNLNTRDISIISDLRFLVTRVKQWYEMNGNKIAIPTKTSSLKKNYKEMTYIEGKEPSENQKISLTNIFENPFSYIWGAPGTGKTQYVLAYAALHYISKNKRIAILAPTNNSIEQVLKGVISMTNKAGIDKTKIIRLGTPSKNFAKDHPEVCEERGIQKKIDEVDKQINILERIVRYENSRNTLELAKLNIQELKKIEPLQAKVISSKTISNESKKAQKKIEIDIKYLDNDIQKLSTQKQTCLNSIESIGYKLKKIFSSKATEQELAVSNLEISITNKSKEIDLLRYTYDEMQEEVNKKFKTHQKAILDRNELISLIKTSFTYISNFKDIIAELNESNWADIRLKLENIIESETEKLEIDEHLLADYKTYTLGQLEDELQQNIDFRNKLASSTTEERIKTVNIIACTLDGYIGRYTDSKLNVEHIFLDEAGYANIIKALTLFNQDMPITFLGDHMQLPPVCEITNTKIEREEEYKNLFIWSQSAIYLETLFLNSRDEALLKYLRNLSFDSKLINRTILNSTFRFGSKLSDILAKYIYENNLNSTTTNGQTDICFINAQKIEGSKSWSSINEVLKIKDYTNYLKANGLDYVILAPYKNQIKLLVKHLPEETKELKILTVHGSQGKEWDTVILSVVDASDMFLVNANLLIGRCLINTAVSRTKSRLVIVCDVNYWKTQKNQLITELINAGTEIKI